MSAMLRSLRIRNLALVDELEWELPPAFTAVTGETGAGKSIILGALKFLLGERADRGVVRTGEESASIEAFFSITDTAEIDALLEVHGIDSCQEEGLILRRTIAAEGSGRQFINGSPCNLAVLKDLGTRLVDLHGPHDHQSLFSRRDQTMLLDRFSEALPLRDEYMACRSAMISVQREIMKINELGNGTGDVGALQAEIDEITAASLLPDEEEILNSRYRAASNSRRLIEISASVVSRLEDEDRGVTGGVAEAVRLLRELGRLDARATPHHECLERVGEELSSFLAALRDYAGAIEVDAAELQVLENRINLLATLRRKYGPTLPDVIARVEQSSQLLERLSNVSELRKKTELRLAESGQAMAASALRLGQRRREAAVRLASIVACELSDLGFKQAGFEISLEPLAEPGPDGAELAEFLFAPNPGVPAQPLRAIASSGEISRVMLALKSALAAQDRIPLLVFDEIDANVGGEIATNVAEKMRQLGTSHQVLCITHLPQVAAAAASQFTVVKSVIGGRTETRLESVVDGARITEIARMLGGGSASAKAHAITLLEQKRQNAPSKPARHSRNKAPKP